MFNVINIIPTGVGAAIGGFAGDANPVNSVLENICDNVITHPNAVNAASLYAATAKTMYVEGFALDEFMKGNLNLKKQFNRIGVIVDKTAVPKLTHIVNALNACITVFGAELTGYIITDEAINPVVNRKNGLFNGVVNNPETMFRAAEQLIEQGATALAVFTVLENPFEADNEEYLNGKGADPIGRLEAIISHLLVEKFMLPCAHAPVFLDDYERIISDPRVAAEEIGFTYIPCVIRGLQHSPAFVKTGGLSVDGVNAVMAPFSCMGGEWLQPVLAKKIPVLAVRENETVLTDTPENTGFTGKIIVADNYLEAIGILMSMKSNVSYKALRRPVAGVRNINLKPDSVNITK